jgi:hypothetical protein
MSAAKNNPAACVPEPAPRRDKDDAAMKDEKARSVDLVAAGTRPGAVARLDAAIVKAVTGTAERARSDPGILLPATPLFAEQVSIVYAAARQDMETGADQTAIREFLTLSAERRNLPVPSFVALDLDAAAMAQWPQDLFAKAARLVWERFADMRVPNSPDFLAYIADDLAARREQIAALHTLEAGLRTIARRGGEQIPVDTFTAF